MQICATVKVHGSKWIDEGNPRESHLRLIMSVGGTGRKYPNLLVSRYGDGVIRSVDLNAPLRQIPPDIVLLLATEAANYQLDRSEP